MPLASVPRFWRRAQAVLLQAQKMVRRPLTLPDQRMPPPSPVPQRKGPRLETKHPSQRSRTLMLEEAEHPFPLPLCLPPIRFRRHCRLKLRAAAGSSSTPGRSGRPTTPRTSRKRSLTLTVFLKPIQSCLDKISQIVNFSSRKEEDRLSKSTNRAKKDATAQQMQIVQPDPPLTQTSL